MNINIKIVGDAAFNRRSKNLKRYAVQIANAPAPLVFRQEAIDKAVAVAQVVYKYPPPRPTSKYKRTFRMQRSWVGFIKGNTAVITNDAAAPKTGVFYPIYVIGAFQTPIHAETGWQKRSPQVEKAIVKPILEDVKKRSIQLLEQSKNA